MPWGRLSSPTLSLTLCRGWHYTNYLWTEAAAPRRSFNCGFFSGTGKELAYLERDEEVYRLPNFLLDGLAQVSGQLQPWSLCG